LDILIFDFGPPFAKKQFAPASLLQNASIFPPASPASNFQAFWFGLYIASGLTSWKPYAQADI